MIDTTAVKQQIRSSRRPDDPARLIAESMGDQMEPAAFATVAEAIVRALATHRE